MARGTTVVLQYGSIQISAHVLYVRVKTLELDNTGQKGSNVAITIKIEIRNKPPLCFWLLSVHEQTAVVLGEWQHCTCTVCM
jgi:hypothetical protein